MTPKMPTVKPPVITQSFTFNPQSILEYKPTIKLSKSEYKKLKKRYNKSKSDDLPVGTVIGKGDYPVQPSYSDIVKFRQNRDRIVPPLVKSDIKKHGGIFHGRHNLNQEYKRLLGSKAQPFLKETYDFDVWVSNPMKRAERMQHLLDLKAGCDIAYAVKQPAPRDAKSRWVVQSRANYEKPEVDYVSYPDPDKHPYRTVKHDGIEHETLESSIAREYVLLQHPGRGSKARKTINNYIRFKNYQKEVKS